MNIKYKGWTLNMEELMENLQIMWDYLCLNTKPEKSDCIIGLGSILTLVPKKCAELYKNKLGDYIVFSGNCGKGTKGVISITEAERFKSIAMDEGVPANRILVEPNATSTYENFKYIKKVLTNNDLNPNSFLIIGKPYQERRALRIADIELVGKKYEVASMNIKLSDYLNFVKKDEFMSVEDAINEIVGEIFLIIKTPRYGLQAEEQVPTKVMDSYNKVVDLGYNKYIYSEDTIKSIIEYFKKKEET